MIVVCPLRQIVFARLRQLRYVYAMTLNHNIYSDDIRCYDIYHSECCYVAMGISYDQNDKRLQHNN